MISWYVLRYYLNRFLPRKYAKGRVNGNQVPINLYTDKEVIVSLTTYPARIKTLPLVLETLFHQTVMPSRVILWLAYDQFKEKDVIVRELHSFVERGLEIRFCEDLRAHKKYYYTMKENPNALVITVDDDILYPEDMVELLIKRHVDYPACIISCRAHEMKFQNGEPAPYSSWNMLAKGCLGPSIKLCATGGAGCLYPPGSLSEHVFDKEVFMDLCRYADDIWLKCMSYLNGTSVVLTDVNNPEIITVIVGNHGNGLAELNVVQKKNDEQLRKVTSFYHIQWGGI